MKEYGSEREILVHKSSRAGVMYWVYGVKVWVGLALIPFPNTNQPTLKPTLATKTTFEGSEELVHGNRTLRTAACRGNRFCKGMDGLGDLREQCMHALPEDICTMY